MSDILASGIELMLVGMGTVFVFLTLLVGAMQAMSALILRYFPSASSVPDRQSAPAANIPTNEEVAAISIALRIHRQRRS
jgi:oxaloacetate decarboxylase gamma subunit